MTTVGVIFPPELPPEDLRDVALAADVSGVDELWIWEDCFKESGIATAAAVLGWTRRVAVGIGLLPVPLRNVALTAMEIATLERLFPGRLRPGIGHGVLDWMAQVGARAASPMTLLAEYTVALRRLLHGETVSVPGQYVQLDNVALDWPPVHPSSLLVGAVGPRTVRLAVERGDGIILTGDQSLADVRVAASAASAAHAHTDRPFEVVAFATVPAGLTCADIAALIGDYAEAGATTVALYSVGDDRPALAEFVRQVGDEVMPIVSRTDTADR